MSAHLFIKKLEAQTKMYIHQKTILEFSILTVYYIPEKKYSFVHFLYEEQVIV